jgi:cytochrome P450
VYSSTRNFKDPEKYHPERWLGDEHFADDEKAALQPFSTGPRDCIGKK